MVKFLLLVQFRSFPEYSKTVIFKHMWYSPGLIDGVQHDGGQMIGSHSCLDACVYFSTSLTCEQHDQYGDGMAISFTVSGYPLTSVRLSRKTILVDTTTIA